MCYSLYVGSRNDRDTIGPDDDERIAQAVSSAFESFSVQELHGWFRGRREQARLIRIATDEEDRVITLAQNLRRMLGQDGIGIECGGHYRRITANG